MGVLLAPFLRKFGAYTVPTLSRPPLREPHAARRRGRRPGRAPPAAARGRGALCRLRRGLAARAVRAPDGGRWWWPASPAIVIAGGMRSLTWSSAAKAIAALLALAVPATIVALMMSNLPLPQMTHGNVLRVLTRTEVARGVPIFAGAAAGLRLSGRGPRAAGQALHPVLRQRRQPGVRADDVRGGGRHRRLARRCCRAPAPRPASTRRASRSAGRCWWPASCC